MHRIACEGSDFTRGFLPYARNPILMREAPGFATAREYSGHFLAPRFSSSGILNPSLPAESANYRNDPIVASIAFVSRMSPGANPAACMQNVAPTRFRSLGMGIENTNPGGPERVARKGVLQSSVPMDSGALIAPKPIESKSNVAPVWNVV